MTDELTPLRLTRTVREQALAQNEGVQFATHFSDRNSSFTNRYTVEGGNLVVQTSGKVPFEGRFTREPRVLDDASAHDILRRYRDNFDFTGVDPKKPASEVFESLPAVAAGVAPEAEDVLVFADEASLRDWMSGLTPKQRAALGVGTVIVLGVAFAAVKYGPALWSEKIVPGAKQLRAKFGKKPAGTETDG